MTTSITPADYPALASELAGDPTGQGYAAMSSRDKLGALLFRPQIDNPEDAPQVPKPISLASVITLVPRGERASLSQATVQRVRELAQAGDVEGLSLLVQWLNDRANESKGDDTLSDATAAALAGELSQTIPDPNHPAKVRGDNRATEVLGREIHSGSIDDIDAALA